MSDARATLRLDAGLPDMDAAYRTLALAHRGLSEAQSAALNAALVLVLANQIGDQAVLEEALALARRTLVEAGVKDSLTPAPSASR